MEKEISGDQYFNSDDYDIKKLLKIGRYGRH